MPRPKRNSIERELDLVFLLNLARTEGVDFRPPRAHEMLNAMRAELARRQAEALDLSPQEIEEAVENSSLTVQTVRRDLALARKRLQAATLSGMALLIEDQIGQLQEELEDSYQTHEDLKKEIEHSRRISQRATKGRFRLAADQARHSAAGQEALQIIGQLGLDGSEPGDRLAEIVGQTMSAPPVEPQDLVTVVREGPGAAAFYTRIVAERDQRRKIRQEMRELFYGRDFVGTEHGDRGAVQVLTGQADVAAARANAIAALADELNRMTASDTAGPWTAEMQQAQRARTSDMLTRIRAFKELASATGGDGEDEDDGFAFRVLVVDPDTGAEKPAEIFPDMNTREEPDAAI